MLFSCRECAGSKKLRAPVVAIGLCCRQHETFCIASSMFPPESPVHAARAKTLVCHFDLPIRLGGAEYRYIPVTASFREISADHLGRWLMHPDGRPRADRELAKEVLLNLQRSHKETGLTSPLLLDVNEVVHFDKAAAIIVAAFLAAMPRPSIETVRRKRRYPKSPLPHGTK